MSDFLYRAAQVYGERVRIVDEPDQLVASLSELMYRDAAALTGAKQRSSTNWDVGDGVATGSHNSAATTATSRSATAVRT